MPPRVLPLGQNPAGTITIITIIIIIIITIIIIIITIIIIIIIITIIIKGHWGRTGWCLSLLREYGRSRPPESWVTPLASARNPKATHVRVTTTSYDERMSNIEFHPNDVNETRAFSEGVASGRCPVDQQHRPGRHPATAELRQRRLGWTKEDNKRLFECYARSKPERRGYRKRLLDLWKAYNTNTELTKVTEQRLADQVRQIKNKKWLETAEQEEIYQRIRDEDQATETTEVIPTATLDHATASDNQDELQDEGSMPVEEEPRVFTAPDQTQEGISLEEDALRNRILHVMQLVQRVGLPSLKSCDTAKLRVELGKVNEAVKRIQTHNITELNSLLYAAAYVTTERMGMLKERRGRRTDEPFWKRRVKRNIDTWRKDLSKIEEVRRGNMKLKQRKRDRLNRKYHLEERGTMYVSGMLKQKIKAGGRKVKRYDERCQQYKQNQLFRTNQKLFYETKRNKEKPPYQTLKKQPPSGVKSGQRKLAIMREHLG